MPACTVTEGLRTVRGTIRDYKRLSGYHYRDERLGPFSVIFALRLEENFAALAGTETVGVIVYTMPSAGLELRNVATAGVFNGLDGPTQLALINKNVRCIGRVIIEPRFRGLGLAAGLVRQTMPKVNVPIVEAMAVMGLVNPFFEKAGMTAYRAAEPARALKLKEAFSLVGIEQNELTDAHQVQKKLDNMGYRRCCFIEKQIDNFLQSYGKRRYMPAGIERTGYVLSKLTSRPMYYIWFNKNIRFKI